MSIAVFRGSLHRLNVYSSSWRVRGPRRTAVAPGNWQYVGRTALIANKARAPDLFNVNVAPGGVIGHSDQLHVRMRIPNSTMALLDEPVMLSFADQVARFKYAINIEGHGGWADRLYKLFLSPQLVLLQDVPARLWYEAPMRPWVHYVPVDSALRNLTDAVRWARQHDVQAQEMVRASNLVMRRWMNTSAIFRYEEELLLGYSQLFEQQPQPPARRPRAVRFTCEPSNVDNPAGRKVCRRKTRNRGEPQDIVVRSTHCFFDASRNGRSARAGSLYEAAVTLGDADSEDSRPHAHSPSVLQALASPTGHREPLDGSKLEQFAARHGLMVESLSTASW